MTTAMELEGELDEMAMAELAKDGAREREQEPPRAPKTIDMNVDKKERDLAVATHIATIAAAVFTGGMLDIVVPAIAYMVFKDKSTFLKEHVRHQLNFQLTNLIVAIAAVALGTFGLGFIIAVPLLIVYFITDVVCSIKAAIAASRGQEYTFPISLKLV